MRIGGKKIRIAIILLLLLVLGYAGYQIGLYGWGSYHSRAAEQSLERRDFRQAILHLKKCQSVWPNDPTPCLLLAQTARRQGDFGETRRQLHFYKKKHGPPAALQLELQFLRLQQGDLAEADMLLAFCTEHPDGLETPLVLEALVVGHLNNLSEETLVWTTPERRQAAAEDLTRARRAVDLWLSLRSAGADRVQGLIWSGQIHNLAVEYPKDVEDYRRALAIDPDNYTARMFLALTLIPYDPQEAADHLERLRQSHPDKPLVPLELATLRRGLGQLEEARKLLDDILTANPDNVTALIERGNVALDTQHFEEAEYRFRRAVSLSPNDKRCHFALNRCLQLTGRGSEAKEHRARFEAIEAEVGQRTEELVARLKAARKAKQDKLDRGKKATAEK